MAILDKVRVLKPYLDTATGKVKELLSSQHVVMDNGNTLETELKNNFNGQKFSDSGWLSTSDGNARYRKKNGIVTVVVHASYNSNKIGAPTYSTGSGVLTALPVGYRPAVEMTGLATPRDNSGYEVQYSIMTDGRIMILSLTNALKFYYSFNVTYPVD